MKAIRIHEFGGSEVMRLEEAPDPRPAPGEVLVRINAAGVNPVDTYIRSGLYAVKPALPYTPGIDGAGVVETVGAEVRHVKPGDRVYIAGTLSGAYAEKTLCAASQVHHLPARVSFSQGAALGVPYSTAYRALFQKAGALPGETVLVHGASGGVGLAAVQLARAAGTIVIGTAGSEQGQNCVIREGAHHVFSHRSADYLDQVVAVTEGRGVDVILEMLANVNLGKDLGILARGGRVVVIGSRGSVEINPRDLIIRDASVLAMSVLNAPEQELARIHAALGAGLENGTLRPVVGRELPLAEAVRAHEEVMESGRCGKIVLVP
jgi:NADPH2:quinone reductase